MIGYDFIRITGVQNGERLVAQREERLIDRIAAAALIFLIPHAAEGVIRCGGFAQQRCLERGTLRGAHFQGAQKDLPCTGAVIVCLDIDTVVHRIQQHVLHGFCAFIAIGEIELVAFGEIVGGERDLEGIDLVPIGDLQRQGGEGIVQIRIFPVAQKIIELIEAQLLRLFLHGVIHGVCLVGGQPRMAGGDAAVALGEREDLSICLIFQDGVLQHLLLLVGERQTAFMHPVVAGVDPHDPMIHVAVLETARRAVVFGTDLEAVGNDGIGVLVVQDDVLAALCEIGTAVFRHQRNARDLIDGGAEGERIAAAEEHAKQHHTVRRQHQQKARRDLQELFRLFRRDQLIDTEGDGGNDIQDDDIEKVGFTGVVVEQIGEDDRDGNQRHEEGDDDAVDMLQDRRGGSVARRFAFAHAEQEVGGKEIEECHHRRIGSAAVGMENGGGTCCGQSVCEDAERNVVARVEQDAVGALRKNIHIAVNEQTADGEQQARREEDQSRDHDVVEQRAGDAHGKRHARRDKGGAEEGV